MRECLHACLSTNGRFLAQHNENHTSFFNLHFDNFQQPFQRRTADSSFFGFPDRHDEHAGSSLHAQGVGQPSDGCGFSCSIQLLGTTTVLQKGSFASSTFGTWPMSDTSMMFTMSICSTLAILIGFSLSIYCFLRGDSYWLCHHGHPSPGVRWQSCGWRFFSTNAHSIGSLACVPASVFVTDLFSLCCPLSLAADGADFMSSLLLESGSGSTGFSLGSRAAGVADSGTGTVAAASPSLLLLSSALRASAASASLHLTWSHSRMCHTCSWLSRYHHLDLSTMLVGMMFSGVLLANRSLSLTVMTLRTQLQQVVDFLET